MSKLELLWPIFRCDFYEYTPLGSTSTPTTLSSIGYAQPMTRRSDLQWSWCGYNDRISHQHVPVGRVNLDDDQYNVRLG
eukprot:scaffold1581_cov124-Skeletonema_dohrnii-CCMP3373.AAC.6